MYNYGKFHRSGESDPNVHSVTVVDDHGTGYWREDILINKRRISLPNNIPTLTLEVFQSMPVRQRNRYAKSDGKAMEDVMSGIICYMKICDRDNSSKCTEFMRWITTYGREGSGCLPTSLHISSCWKKMMFVPSYQGANKEHTVKLLFRLGNR